MQSAQMGTFAETADVNHRLPFANQGKTKFSQKTSKHLCCFGFSFATNTRSCHFPIVLFSAYIYILKKQHIYRYIILIYIYIYLYIYGTVSNGKRKPQRFKKNPFTICSSCKRKFVICPLVYQVTNRSYPSANRLNRHYKLSRLKELTGLAHL